MIALAPPTVAADSHSDVKALKRAFGCFPSGVIALRTSLDDGNPVGIAVSSLTSVSMESRRGVSVHQPHLGDGSPQRS